MKINYDFTKHQTLGNVHNSAIIDNYKEFNLAKELVINNQMNIDDSLSETIENASPEFTVGTILSIPTSHLNNHGFIQQLKFIVDEIVTDETSLSLSYAGPTIP